MRVADLKGKKIVIWGLGNEGKSAAAFIHAALPGQLLIFIDEAQGPDSFEGSKVIREPAAIAAALDDAEILVKSPGVSLYHPLIQKLHSKGVPITSLLNLWMAEPRNAKVLCVTGTKGKSTASTLLAHTLNGLGKKAMAVGNLGVSVTEATDAALDYIIVEVSSYQAATFSGACDVALLTTLYPEHLDWHKTLENYFRDKLNLLAHAKTKIINTQALPTMKEVGVSYSDAILFNAPEAFHVKAKVIYDGDKKIGVLQNSHLSRAHNLSNVCAVLTVIKYLGFDVAAALQVMESFRGLPHRQEELGEKDGVLYVNDSIATTPQATIAALEAYMGKSVTLIAGGYDRGIDYSLLIDYLAGHKPTAVICMGATGQRIFDALNQKKQDGLFLATSMPEAVDIARKHTIKGGVLLLSPAAPSYGLFKDFIERGKAFAEACGFKVKA